MERRVLLAAALAASSLSCGREITGPGANERLSGPLSFAPEFPAALRAAGGRISRFVAFERVRVLFRRSDGTVAFDKTFDFPSDADSLPVVLNVPISSGAPESGEPMLLSLFYVDATNDTVFTGGPVPVNVRPARAGEPSPPIGVTLTYTGPGDNAVRVVLTPSSASIPAGQSQTFTTQAFDQFNTPVTAPVLFESTDTSVVSVSETGVGVARNRRASAFVIAKLFSGPADSSSVSVILPASQLVASSGSGQSGAAGTVLPQNVVVRVTASDGVPVSGVAVTFAATNGGAPGTSTVNTDASGFASTNWTLGNTVGTQTMTATAAGLTGSPVSFTATATPAIPSALVFTTQPSTTVAGVAISPAVVVQARTTGGTLAVGYTDSVSIAIGTNPATGTLGGVRTVAAVNGTATFAGLTLDRAGNGYTLVASSGALTAATSAAFNLNAAAATTLIFTVQPAGGTPGLALAPAPAVRAVDAFGNLASFAGNIMLTIGANPGGTTLGGTTTRAAVANIATFPDLTLGATGTGYTLVAAATGLTGVTSDPFNIGAQTISWANASGGNWSVAANWNLNRVPNAADVVEISLNGTYTVNLDVNANVAGIQMGASASGTQTLQMVSRTLTLAGDLLVSARGALNAYSSSIAGSGSVVNDGAVLLSSSSVTLTTNNRMSLLASGNSALTGPVLNASGAVLRVAQIDGCCSSSNLTVSNGFTNQGTIELSNQFTVAFGAQLTVTTGTLVNAVGATIAAVGGQTPGGPRALAAQLDNQGTVTLAVPLTLNRANSAHVNSGTIDLTLGDLSVPQSGTAPSFTNTGTITLATGRTWSVTSGGLHLAAGSVSGAGTLALANVTANFTTPFTNAVTGLTVSGSVINGSGTLTNAAGRTLTLFSSTVNAPLVNDGLLVSSGNSAVNGTFTQSAAATLRVAQLDGCCSASVLTVSNGFTNPGLIELSNQFSVAFGAQLTVTNGTLVNASSGTIAVLGGQTPGGPRALAAQLDNQGTVTLAVPLTLNRANSAHVNSGTIDLTVGDLSVPQSGTAPSFTNTGTITLAAGQTWSVSSGSLSLAAGSLSGAGTLALANVTANFTTPFTNAVTGLAVSGSSISGAGTITNAAGRTLTLFSSTVNAPLVNDGLLVSSGNSAINGTFTQAPAATLRVAQIDGCCSSSVLTMGNGFTNPGTIELSNQFTVAFGAQLTVTSGTLINASSGTIAVLGGQTPGGPRTLAAQLDNQGSLTLSVPLSINRANSAHINSGTIDLTIADLSLAQSGTAPSFTNTGVITLAAGRSWSIASGSLSLAAGSLSGAGTLALSNVIASIATGFTNAVTTLTVAGSSINGPGTLTNAAGRTLTLFNSTVNAALVNDGLLVSSGTTAINGTFTQAPAATLRVAQLDGCCSSSVLTVSNGFTNPGLIELSNQFTVAFGAQLTVTNGTLINAASGTIAVLGGQTPGGPRVLAAQLDNQGAVTLAVPLSINRASSAHVNSGTIDLTVADLSVPQSGTVPSFTNTGTITLAAGRTWSVASGSLHLAAGSVSGAGTLALSNVAATFTTPFTNAVTGLTVAGSVINGPGTLTNAAGRTLTLFSSTVNAALVNDGLLVSSGNSAVNGTFTQSAAATLRVAQLDGCCSSSILTVSNGFTNPGTIELSNQFTSAFGAQLTVTSGTLVNASGGTIAVLGGQTPGGPRALAAQLDNQGTMTLGVPLTINRASSAHVNSGVIDATAADLSIVQSGTAPSFSNTGTFSVGAGRTLSLSGGLFSQSAGTIGGAGTISLTSMTIEFATPFTNATTQLNVAGSTINGTAAVTNAAGRTLTLFNSTVNAPLVNDGLLVASGSSGIGGTFINSSGATLRVAQLDGCCSTAILTAANGFTNQGTIELSNQFTVAYGAQLNVSSGTLVNAPTGTIAALGGQTPGGARTLGAQLDNQGTITLGVPLAINRASSAHLNSGLINVSAGDLSVVQSGGGATFTNNGTISIAAERTVAVSNGSFSTGVGATISGAGGIALTNVVSSFNDATPAVASIALNGGSATFAQATGTATTAWSIAGATLNSSAPFTNAAGQSLTLVGSTINAPFSNAGTLISSGASSITGALSTAPSSVIRVGQVDGSTSLANLTVANGFTNNGTLELTVTFAVAYNTQLTISAGTLLNAAGGTIVSSNGAAAGGTRTIVASGGVDNQGTIRVGTGTAGRLAITGSLVTTGTLDLELGGATIATQYDHLQVSGAVTLGGTLNVSLINLFTPAAAQTFTPITFGSRTGTFTTTNLPASIVAPPLYQATTVTLTGQ